MANMTTDIRVGDLIKATRKDDPEVTVTSRVRQVADSFTQIRFQCLYHDHWDIAVLDRPKPVIPEDLFEGAMDLYREAETTPLGIKAVIHHVNEYYNKKGTNA